MDLVQLTLIALGLLAIVGGAVALTIALFTLRATSPRTEPAPRAVAPPQDPAPTLDQVQSPPSLRPSAELAPEIDEHEEDEIPTTVLNAGDYDDLDALIAAVDGLEPRDRR